MLNYVFVGGLGEMRFYFEIITLFLVMIGLPFSGLTTLELAHEFVMVVASVEFLMKAF